MGGTSSQNQQQNTVQSGLQTTSPWASAGLSGILSNLNGISPNLTGAQQSAIGNLTDLGQSGNPYTGQVGNVANNLLSGGGANQYAPMAQNAYSQYQQQLSPYLQQSYLDPRNTPGFGDALSALNSDITGQVNGQFAAAGRDLSGMNSQALARGLSQGEGQLLANQYNQNVSNQLGAANSLYGAGGNTAGLLSGLNQTGLANQQAGIGAAQQAFQAQQSGPLLALQAQSQITGIPLQILAQQAGISLPAAQAFGTTNSTQTGTQTGQTQNQMSGAQQFALISGGLKNLFGGSGTGSSGGGGGWLGGGGFGGGGG